MAKSFKIALTGEVELDRELRAIASDTGSKSINAAMRKFTREVVKEIVLPEVIALIPTITGFLESQVIVRAIKRSRSKIGYFVGFPDPLFTGDTFYGGFIEFGFDHKGGFAVEPDSFLRRALYPNAERIFSRVRQRMRQWMNDRNRAAS